MIYQLHLLRHGKSSWPDGPTADIDRPLNPRGERASVLMGSYIEQEGLEIDLVVCSPALRTRQTLERLRRFLPDHVQVEIVETVYEAPVEALLETVRALSDGKHSVLVVGHNPGLEDLAVLLAGEQADVAGFPTGGLATLEFDLAGWRDVGPGRGRLVRLVAPKDLV